MKAKIFIQITLAVVTGLAGLLSLLLGLYLVGGSPAPFFVAGLGSLTICGLVISSLRSQSKLSRNGEGQKPNSQ